jgi:hypothetical protein
MTSSREGNDRRVGAELLRSSAVTLFHRRTLLGQATRSLREAGYHVVEIDVAHCATKKDMHRELAVALDFPDYYGANLDAFNDCLGDVANHAYGWPEDVTGLVLVLLGFNHFAGTFPELAHDLLDIFAGVSRTALVNGEQLICLIQSTDARFELAPIGCTPVTWNSAEWSNASRGV